MASNSSQWQWGNQIRGGAIRARVRESLLSLYQDELTAKPLTAEILRFAPPEYNIPLSQEQERILARYRAAEDSTRVKVASFRMLEVSVPEREPLPQTMLVSEFQALIDRLNTDPSVSAIIVQYPVPLELEPIISSINPQKDLDALSQFPLFASPATSEGIFRVVEPFAQGQQREESIDVQSEAVARIITPFSTTEDITVAVVGARGFVGRGVIRLLEEQGINCLPIDLRDEGFQEADLLRVRDADIVVSATGQPGILDGRHLTPYHRLVVDCGYVPIGDNKLGDIAVSAYGIPQNITPVPGGTGPIEMAVLMERIIRKEIDPNIESWRLEDYQTIRYYNREQLAQMQQQWAAEIYPIVRATLVANQARSQQPSPGVVTLEGNNYILIADQNTDQLTVQGQSSRGEIARYSLRGEVQSAVGLTAKDQESWQSTKRSLQAFLRQQHQQPEIE